MIESVIFICLLLLLTAIMAGRGIKRQQQLRNHKANDVGDEGPVRPS